MCKSGSPGPFAPRAIARSILAPFPPKPRLSSVRDCLPDLPAFPRLTPWAIYAARYAGLPRDFAFVTHSSSPWAPGCRLAAGTHRSLPRAQRGNNRREAGATTQGGKPRSWPAGN
jgi:hypothetical protein